MSLLQVQNWLVYVDSHGKRSVKFLHMYWDTQDYDSHQTYELASTVIKPRELGHRLFCVLDLLATPLIEKDVHNFTYFKNWHKG
jgi:hypothetical protein